MPTESVQKEFFEYSPEEGTEAQEDSTKKPLPNTERGYYISCDEASRTFESALDKWSRLKNEVAELRQELTGAALPDPEDATPDVSALAKEIEQMRTSLGSASNDRSIRPYLGEEAQALAALPSADEMASTVLSQVSTGAGAGAGAGGSVQYDVWRTPTEDSDLLKYDRRLAALTQVVGATGGLPKGGQSLRARLADLHARLGCTEEYKLDAVYRRTKSLITEIDTVELPELTGRRSTDGTAPEPEDTDAAKHTRMSQLNSMVSKLNPTAAALAQVVDRLKTQKDLHEGASGLVARLQRLETLQSSAAAVLQTDAAVAAKTSTELASSLQTMTSNLALLQSRMDAVAKRM